MDALRYASYGRPEDVLSLVDLETERLARRGVLLDVLAVPIHLKDLYFMSGRDGFRLLLPAIPGNQAFGRVADIGADVDTVAVGDHVHVLHREPWTDPLPGGTWRRETIAPEGSVFRSPWTGEPPQMGLVSSSLISADLLLREVRDSTAGAQGSGASRDGKVLFVSDL